MLSMNARIYTLESPGAVTRTLEGAQAAQGGETSLFMETTPG